MKLPLQIATAIVLPPVATFLAWNDIIHRPGLSAPLRGWWVVVAALPTLGVLLYLGIGKGRLW